MAISLIKDNNTTNSKLKFSNPNLGDNDKASYNQQYHLKNTQI